MSDVKPGQLRRWLPDAQSIAGSQLGTLFLTLECRPDTFPSGNKRDGWSYLQPDGRVTWHFIDVIKWQSEVVSE